MAQCGTLFVYFLDALSLAGVKNDVINGKVDVTSSGKRAVLSVPCVILHPVFEVVVQDEEHGHLLEGYLDLHEVEEEVELLLWTDPIEDVNASLLDVTKDEKIKEAILVELLLPEYFVAHAHLVDLVDPLHHSAVEYEVSDSEGENEHTNQD